MFLDTASCTLLKEGFHILPDDCFQFLVLVAFKSKQKNLDVLQLAGFNVWT